MIGRCTVTAPKDGKQQIDTSVEKDIGKLHVSKHRLINHFYECQGNESNLRKYDY